MPGANPPDDPQAGEPGAPAAPSLAARTGARMREGRERAQVGLRALEARRPGSPAVDLAFTLAERDREIYAGTLAGALAFRLFLFLLPMTLVLIVVLGFVISNDPDSSQGLADRFGLRGALAEALVEATNQGRTNRWWALGVGLIGTAWAALGSVRAIRLVHFLAWDQPPQPLRRAHRAAGAFVAANVLILGAPLLAGWARAVFGVIGDIGGIVGVFAVYTALWVVLSAYLPHGATRWRFLVPGAFMLVVGMQVLHLVTVYVFAPRLEQSASVYGAIGVAAVMLTWLFLIARLIVTAAVLNAVLHERRARRQPSSGG